MTLSLIEGLKDVSIWYTQTWNKLYSMQYLWQSCCHCNLAAHAVSNQDTLPNVQLSKQMNQIVSHSFIGQDRAVWAFAMVASIYCQHLTRQSTVRTLAQTFLTPTAPLNPGETGGIPSCQSAEPGTWLWSESLICSQINHEETPMACCLLSHQTHHRSNLQG